VFDASFKKINHDNKWMFLNKVLTLQAAIVYDNLQLENQ